MNSSTMNTPEQAQKDVKALMTNHDRQRTSVLVVESDASSRNTLRQILTGLGYGLVFDAPNHTTALQKLAERPITHVVFDAKKSTMPSSDFLTAVLACDERIIALPTSSEPSVDDVFNLLIIGAKGYIVKPYTSDGVDEAIAMATKGEPLSEAILFAKDRNEALVSLMMTALDKLALTARQSSQFETAKRELGKRAMGFKRAVDISMTFAEGGKPRLLEALIEFCIERGNGPATRLGRVRKRLSDRKPKLPRLNPEGEGPQLPMPDELAEETADEADANFAAQELPSK